MDEVPSKGATGEGLTSNFTSVVIGRILILDGRCAESFSSQWAVGWRLPSGPCPTKKSSKEESPLARKKLQSL